MEREKERYGEQERGDRWREREERWMERESEEIDGEKKRDKWREREER